MKLRSAPLCLAALLLAPACASKDKPASDDDDGSPREGRPTTPSPTDRTVPDLIEDVEMDELGAQPGYLPGGLLYVSLRAAETQRFWSSLPKPDDLIREGLEAKREIGFDPVADDWVSHFAMPPDGIVSATILRPLDADIALVRKAVEAKGVGDDAAKRAAAALGYHSRFVIPSTDPDATVAAMLAPFSDRDRDRGDEVCATLGGDRCVYSGSGEIGVFRKQRKTVTADFVFYALGNYSLRNLGILGDVELALEHIPERRDAAKKAIDVQPESIPHTESLAGDAAVWVDPSLLGRLAAIDKLDEAVTSVEYEGTESFSLQLERLARLEGLVDAPRVFPGVGVSFDFVGDNLYGVAHWPVAGALWGRMALRAVTTKSSKVDVPTIPALCKDAIACFRAQAIPDTRPVAKRIVAAGFAKPFEDVTRALDRDEEYTATLVFAGAWLNLLAAGVDAPSSLQGPEAGIAATVRDAVLRTDGFGGAVRSYAWGTWGPAAAEYAFYARAAKQDIEAAKGLAGLSGEKVRDIELPDGQGRATTLELDDGPMVAHALFQTGNGDFGWAGLASSAAELSRILDLERETPAGPMAYLEFPNLWSLVSPISGAEPGLHTYETWLRSRRLQFVIELQRGQPRLRAALTKR